MKTFFMDSHDLNIGGCIDGVSISLGCSAYASLCNFLKVPSNCEFGAPETRQKLGLPSGPLRSAPPVLGGFTT